MKRRIALLLACLLTVSFMGACSKEVADEGSGATVKDETPVAIEPAEEEEVEEVATAPTYALTSVTADDYTYFTGGVQCIQITDDKHPELSAAIDAQFSDLVSSFNKSAESMNKEAEEMNAENKKYAEENPDIEYYET
nr:hypothetical protein [Pseudobutyrivibrio sp.]